MRHPRTWLATLLLSSCAVAGIADAFALVVTTSPTLTMDPTGYAPLAGRVDLATDVPARVTLLVSGNGRTWAVRSSRYETTHAMPVLGLRPEAVYTVRVAVTDLAGESLSLAPELSAVTGQLPADFPTVTLLASDPPRMEPGFTMLDRFTRSGGGEGTTYSFFVDASGEVVWYTRAGGGAMQQLPNGSVLYRSASEVFQVDMLGTLLGQVTLADPGEGLHHELFRSTSGTLLSLSSTTIDVEGCPTSLTDPTAPRVTAPIQDDPVVEFATDGSLLNIWRLSDLIDPTRAGYDSLLPTHLGLDWAHANAVIDSPADDSLLVSIRHQDAIVKFTRAGRVKWILAPHDNWPTALEPFLLDPVGLPFAWSYHQHAPAWTPAGTLLVFDNGNYRASPFDGTTPMSAAESYSRAVEYAIDEDAMTIRQVWEYRPEGAEQIYSGSRGDVDRLPLTGNVLITYSTVSHVGGTKSCELGFGGPHTRIQEVDHGAPAWKVFELAIFDARGQAGECPEIGVYRSERVPSLYGNTATVLETPRLSLAPAASVVPRGGTLRYVAAGSNDAGEAACYDYWESVHLPDGSRYPAVGELVGPVQVCVDARSSRSQTVSHPIPAGAPTGAYTLSAFLGSYPLALTETRLEFEVAP